MKYLTLGGHFDGTYQEYDPQWGPELCLSWAEQTRVSSFSPGGEEVPFKSECYRPVELKIETTQGPRHQTLLILSHIPDGQKLEWIFAQLLEKYPLHEHCEDIYKRTGRDCYRTHK